MPFKEVMQEAVDLGLLDVVLPFILVFTLSYAVLQYTKVFGVENDKPRTNINAMVAFVLGFLAIAAVNVLDLINVLTSSLVIASIVGLMSAILVGLIGGSSTSAIVAGLSLATFALLALNALASKGVIPDWILPFLMIGALVLTVAFVWPKKAPSTQTAQQAPKEKSKAAPQEISEEDIRKAVAEKNLSAQDFFKIQEEVGQFAEKAAKAELLKKIKEK